MEEKHLDEEKRKIISQALWDLNMSPEEFLGIIEGRIVRKWPDRGFCIARFLESVNWFDVIRVIQPRDICGLWEEAKKHVRSSSIKVGMDFACRILRYAGMGFETLINAVCFRFSGIEVVDLSNARSKDSVVISPDFTISLEKFVRIPYPAHRKISSRW